MALQEVHGNAEIWDEFLYMLPPRYFVFRSFCDTTNKGGVAILLPKLGSLMTEDDFEIDALIPGRVLRVAFRGPEFTFVIWCVHFHDLDPDDVEFALNILKNDEEMAAANAGKFFNIVLGDVNAGAPGSTRHHLNDPTVVSETAPPTGIRREF